MDRDENTSTNDDEPVNVRNGYDYLFQHHVKGLSLVL